LKEIEKTEDQVEADMVELHEKYREEIKWMKLKLVKLKERFYESFINRSKLPELKIVSNCLNVIRLALNYELELGFLADKNTLI
jgi:hypothetical protein